VPWKGALPKAEKGKRRLKMKDELLN